MPIKYFYCTHPIHWNANFVYLYNLDLTNDFCSQQKLGYERKCARPPQTQSNAVDEQKPHQVAASLNKIK